jgi:hypothetical protein
VPNQSAAAEPLGLSIGQTRAIRFMFQNTEHKACSSVWNMPS